MIFQVKVEVRCDCVAFRTSKSNPLPNRNAAEKVSAALRLRRVSLLRSESPWPRLQFPYQLILSFQFPITKHISQNVCCACDSLFSRHVPSHRLPSLQSAVLSRRFLQIVCSLPQTKLTHNSLGIGQPNIAQFLILSVFCEYKCVQMSETRTVRLNALVGGLPFFTSVQEPG